MSQQELLKRVVGVLESLSLEYMISGSYASSLQGEPRSSHDIDLVVLLKEPSLGSLLDAFPGPEFYVPSREFILEAVRTRTMFSLMHVSEGDKVDFWMLTQSPFDQSRFSRKYIETFLDTRVYVSSPEDTILMKLRWCQDSGGSEKQFTDALRVYEVQGDRLDRAYLRHWASQLNVESLFSRLESEAQA